MATAKQKAAQRAFAAKARSGKGSVGKAAKSTAAPMRKRRALRLLITIPSDGATVVDPEAGHRPSRAVAI
jgi:hypothetical protein